MSKKRFIYGFESLFGGPDEGVPQEETPVIALERTSEEEEKPKRGGRRSPARIAANAVADTEQQDKRSATKNFTSDLESLFMDAMKDSYEEDIQEEQTEQAAAAETADVTTQKTTPVNEPVTTAKAADSENDKMPEEAANPKPVRKRRVVRSPRTRGGLDLLIRQTSEETYIEYQSENKRVTFVFDKKKLEKLKVIAKSQKAFLKDIIGDVVSKYIEQYEDSNGDLA